MCVMQYRAFMQKSTLGTLAWTNLLIPSRVRLPKVCSQAHWPESPVGPYHGRLPLCLGLKGTGNLTWCWSEITLHMEPSMLGFLTSPTEISTQWAVAKPQTLGPRAPGVTSGQSKPRGLLITANQGQKGPGDQVALPMTRYFGRSNPISRERGSIIQNAFMASALF